MTRNEFMTRLASELHKRNVADAADVIEEYEQHFTFKLADGYAEEEVAARLGDPVALAAQFGEGDAPKQGSKPLVIAGLCIVDLFAGMFFLLQAGWELVMAAAAIAFGGAGVCLFGGLNIHQWLPPMPYWCGAVLALSLTALTVLLVVGCIYYGAFLRQLVRSFARFHHNKLAAASGEATLPTLPVDPRFSGKTKRRLRTVALVSLALFAACFVLTYVVCALSAGSLEFWHTWGWFLN